MLGIPKIVGQLFLQEVAPKVLNRVLEKKPAKQTPKEPPMDLTLIGAARHMLQLGAGALLARGFIDASGVDMVVGAGVSAVTLGWYLVKRYMARKA